jgi:polar amino acid transport system substrate-binding protein
MFVMSILSNQQRQFFKHTTKFNLFAIASCLLFAVLLISQPSHAQIKIELLFSDAFVDKEKNQPMPDRLYKPLKQLEKKLSIEFDIKIYPWNRAVHMASTEGKLILALSQTAEREKIFKFTEPITTNYIWLVTRKDGTFPYASMKDLKGKTIGIFRGAKYGGEFDELKNKLFEIEESSGSYVERLLKLHNKRFDAMAFAIDNKNAIEVEKLVNDILKTDPNHKSTKDQFQFKVIPIPLFKDHVRIAALRGYHDKLIDDINHYLLKIHR